MKFKGLKFKISLISVLCSVLCMVPLAYAQTEEEYEPPELNIKIPVEYHVSNTPQWDDNIVAEVKPKTINDNQIIWYRFYNAKYDSEGKLIQDSYYVEIARGRNYKVTDEDKGHCLKCEVEEYGLVKETEPVAKKNYGLPDNLKVKNNSYFGDTDGSLYYLDTRMQYSHDQVNIFDVTSDTASLLSGENSDNLTPGGYDWYVRYKGTNLVEESNWVSYHISAGEKIDAEGVNLSATDITLSPDNLCSNITATVYPEHSYVNTIEWSTSDESVATVDQTGKITAVMNGEAIITCTVNKNMGTEVIASCHVNVIDFDKVSYVSITEDNVKISITDESLSRALTYSVYPDRENLTEYTQSWSSSDNNICTVNDGVVKAVGVGEAVVTYTVEQDGKQFTDSVKVTVSPKATVLCVKEWGKNGEGDLTFNFEGFYIDESVVVTVRKANGDYSTVNNCYYFINGNSLIISKNYLSLLPLGETQFIFTMNDKDNSNIKQISSNQKAKIALLGTANNAKPKITLANSTDSGENSVSVTLTLSSKGELSYYLSDSLTDKKETKNNTLSPSHPFVYILTDARTDTTPVYPVSVDYDSSCYTVTPIEYDHKEGASFDYWKYRGFKVEAVGKNSASTIKLIYKDVDYFQGLECKSFLNSLSATNQNITLDYTCRKRINVSNYFISDAPISELENATVTYSVSGENFEKYCELNTKTGELFALKSTETGKPLKITANISQTISNKSEPVVKTANFDLTIKIYELLKRDHLGQWEPLGRVGMNYQIGGIESDYEMNPTKVTIQVADPNGSKERNEFISRMLNNYVPEISVTSSGNLNIKLPYKFMRTLRVGTYAVTFTFYNKNGEVEQVINTSVEVLPAGTPLTGDTFNTTLWLCISVSVLPVIYVIIKKLKKSNV